MCEVWPSDCLTVWRAAHGGAAGADRCGRQPRPASASCGFGLRSLLTRETVASVGQAGGQDRLGTGGSRSARNWSKGAARGHLRLAKRLQLARALRLSLLQALTALFHRRDRTADPADHAGAGVCAGSARIYRHGAAGVGRADHNLETVPD
ncbi:MAG: hypothetical protein ACPIOQ_37540 [Promethearchaeia archaeon]